MTAAFEGIEGAVFARRARGLRRPARRDVRAAGLPDVPRGRPRGALRAAPTSACCRSTTRSPGRSARATTSWPSTSSIRWPRSRCGSNTGWSASRARRSTACARSSRTRSCWPSAAASWRPHRTSSASRSATPRSRPATSPRPRIRATPRSAPQKRPQRYGLVELAGSIADHPDNTTRFLLFRAPVAPRRRRANSSRPRRGADRKTSLDLRRRRQARRAGALARRVRQARAQRLEARLEVAAWGRREFAFYADVDGDVREERFADALRDLREYTSSLHVVGSYDAGTAPPRVRRAIDGRGRQLAGRRPERGRRTRTSRRSRASRVSRARRCASATSCSATARSSSPPGRARVEIAEQVLRGRARDRRARRGRCCAAARSNRAPRRTRSKGMGWEGLALLAEAGRETGTADRQRGDEHRPSRAHGGSRSTCSRSARATCRTSTCSRPSGRRRSRCCSSAGCRPRIDELLGAAEYILAEGNPGRRALRARDPHVRNGDAQHARPLGGPGAARAVAPADHGRSVARRRRAALDSPAVPRGQGGRRERHPDRSASQPGRREERRRTGPDVPGLRGHRRRPRADPAHPG